MPWRIFFEWWNQQKQIKKALTCDPNLPEFVLEDTILRNFFANHQRNVTLEQVKQAINVVCQFWRFIFVLFFIFFIDFTIKCKKKQKLSFERASRMVRMFRACALKAMYITESKLLSQYPEEMAELVECKTQYKKHALNLKLAKENRDIMLQELQNKWVKLATQEFKGYKKQLQALENEYQNKLKKLSDVIKNETHDPALV